MVAAMPWMASGQKTSISFISMGHRHRLRLPGAGADKVLKDSLVYCKEREAFKG
jgi:hypothetical protein